MRQEFPFALSNVKARHPQNASKFIGKHHIPEHHLEK
jgi:hypothetical protein